MAAQHPYDQIPILITLKRDILLSFPLIPHTEHEIISDI
jgi:hypothetical protein